MKMKNRIFTGLIYSILILSPTLAHSEILAMLNYETQPNISPRKEGIAILDVDPNSNQFGKMVQDIPLPNDAVAHHIFYNKSLDKAYVTSLGKGPLYVIHMRQNPLQANVVEIKQCQVAEDLVFTADGKSWYLTCMGSSNVIMGNAHTDQVLKVIAANDDKLFIRYPHGISINEKIDRIMVTSTVRPSDLGDPGDSVTVIRASDAKVLSTHKISDANSAPGSSPVEVVFLPQAEPAMAYINTMFEGKLWQASWDEKQQNFNFAAIYNFADVKQGVPLEIYFSQDHKKLFVSTAKPGALNIFDISHSPSKPLLIKSIATAAGAHHIVFSPDEHYAFVQNNFLNLPEMNDGSISVIDLHKLNKLSDINTLKDKGWKANSIIMMPTWHTDDAH